VAQVGRQGAGRPDEPTVIAVQPLFGQGHC
jgi:hypothetical protein